jgi:hypothetical protein
LCDPLDTTIAATGHAAAPPSAAMNSRRPMVAVICCPGSQAEGKRSAATVIEGRSGREMLGSSTSDLT